MPAMFLAGWTKADIFWCDYYGYEDKNAKIAWGEQTAKDIQRWAKKKHVKIEQKKDRRDKKKQSRIMGLQITL